MNPLFGLLAGSVTMSGGHGTGAAYAKLFGEVNNLQGAMEVAMACATFGLVMGGIIGGPVAERLINRHGLRGTPASPQPRADRPGELGPDDRRQLSPELFFETVLLILLCVGVGSLIAGVVHIPWFTLPTFVWCLLTGIVICNIFSLTGIYRIDIATLELLGTVCLSLFLAMALMALKLWELVGLALPVMAHPGRADGAHGRLRHLGDLPGHGPQLRCGGDRRRPLRLRAGRHADRDRQHAGGYRPARPLDPGLPAGPDHRRLPDRHHQRAGDPSLPRLAPAGLLRSGAMTPIRRLTSALLVLFGLALAGCDQAPDDAAAREVLDRAAGRSA